MTESWSVVEASAQLKGKKPDTSSGYDTAEGEKPDT
jgi:hypothetical protein